MNGEWAEGQVVSAPMSCPISPISPCRGPRRLCLSRPKFPSASVACILRACDSCRSAGGVAWMTHVGSCSAVPPALPAFPLRPDSPKLSNHRPLRSPAGCPHPDSAQVDVIGRVIQRRSGELRRTRTAPCSGDDGSGGFKISHHNAECACLCHGRGGSCPRSSPSRYCMSC